MASHILQPREGSLFDNADASAVQKSTSYGNLIEVSQYNSIAYQAWWDGLDGAGTFQLETSVKSSPLEADWVPKSGGALEASGASGTGIKVVSNIGEKNVRVVWIPDANTTGTVTVIIMAKDYSGEESFTQDNPLQVTASFTGLRLGGRISEVELNDTTWTALPSVPLINRNAISIQNVSGVEMKINYTDSEPDYFGVQIASGVERFYDLTDEITIYGKAQSGNPKIIIEELS